MVAPVNDDRTVTPADSAATEPANVHEEKVEECFDGVPKNISAATSAAIRRANTKAEEAADRLRDVCRGKGLAPQTEIGPSRTEASPKGGMCAKIKVSVTCVAAQPPQPPPAAQEGHKVTDVPKSPIPNAGVSASITVPPDIGETLPLNAPVSTPSTRPAPATSPKPEEKPSTPAGTKPASSIDKNAEWAKLKPSERAQTVFDEVSHRVDSNEKVKAVRVYIINAFKENPKISFIEAVRGANAVIDVFEKRTEDELEEDVIKPAKKAIEEYNKRK